VDGGTNEWYTIREATLGAKPKSEATQRNRGRRRRIPVWIPRECNENIFAA